MLILGIETSCDDTAAAVVRDGTRILSSVVASQDAIHGEYGGVVPELASRRHIEDIIPVVEEALKRANVTMDDIDAVGVTQGPGLVGSILVGLSFAKAVSYVKGKPFVGVNHLEAHPLAVFLEEGEEKKQVPEFPFVALIVSGGHTALLSFSDFIEYRVLGQTRDDAAGEAFDKVAKLLGLGYPGGVAIDTLARDGDPEAFAFTRPYIAKGNLEFSFSGIKTAVRNVVKGLERKAKALWALDKTGSVNLVCAGGVACNSRLRTRLDEMAGDKGIRLFIPPVHFCSDNGAMVAAAAYHMVKKGIRGELSMNARPSWQQG
jgi:N6-L-threonylcarbamoyladenine synthase